MVSLPASLCAQLRQCLQHLLQDQNTYAKEWLHFQGLMAKILEVVPWAPLHLGPVVHHILFHWTLASDNYEASLPVFTPICQNLIWWLHPPSLNRGFPLQSLTSLVLTTNASSLGWRAVLGDLSPQGFWSVKEASMSSNRLELRGVWNALQVFAFPLLDHLVVVRVDNRVVMSYINQQFVIGSFSLNLIVRRIVSLAQFHLLRLQAIHIQGVLNHQADLLS
ncbi:hypothetical protein NDU88_000859 [Pleurodeles waltl]|uniref:RNase H type-1 domain-containing protein n=1 Tax=Pleurodeles waltl TaxID=8319 RepID=A0AAV7TG75_PLEWA|nr:hypothetical protein NDU88_000859 [Pleurodeles waltl]